MINTSIVDKNFSRNPDYYHLNAKTQLETTDKLADIIFQKTDHPHEILEIGCGTGFLTQKILNRYNEAHFTITDISESMLKFCREKTSKIRKERQLAVEFLENDINSKCPLGQYDLIVSSLVFQWLPNLKKVIRQLKEQLSPGGKLIFSTLTSGTFSSVKAKFHQAGIVFPSPEMLTCDQIKDACDCFENIDFLQEKMTEEFPSMQEFLKHIQGTGAGNATGNSLKLSELKKVISPNKHPLKADYCIMYLILN